MLSLKLRLGPYCLQTSLEHFLKSHQMKTHEKIFGGSFQLVSSPWNDMCQQKCTPRNATSFVRVND